MSTEELRHVLDHHLAADNRDRVARKTRRLVRRHRDFRDGLMTGQRFSWDAAGLGRQLGVVAFGAAGHAATATGRRSA